MPSTPQAIVTGGAGFIGSHMVDLLLVRGYQVMVIDNLATGRLDNLKQCRSNPRCEVMIQDVAQLSADAAATLFHGARYVFHFAGLGDIVPSIDRPLDYMRANVDGTLAVLEASRAAGVGKVVYAASSSCYGANPPLPTSENAPIHPEYPYALSKYLAECAVLHWGQVYGLPVASLRIFNAYGPRVRTTGVYGAVFGVFLAQKRHGKPLTVVGDGSQRRDFVHVRDVVRAFLLAAEAEDSGEIFNLGAGNPQTVARLAALIGGEVVHLPERPGEPVCTWANTSKIQRELGWKPVIEFEQGVAEMLVHLNEWTNAPVWEPESIAAATRSWFAVLAGSGGRGKWVA
jgi:UDP-glucose 4-epimerase